MINKKYSKEKNISLMIRVKLTETIEDFETFGLEIIDKDPRVIGLDTETSMNQKPRMGVDIIQLCIKDDNILDLDKSFEIAIPGVECYTVYIFKLFKYYSGILPSSLKKILESNKLIKVGCDITTDVVRIKVNYDFNDRGFVDTQYLAKSLGYAGISLDALSQKLMNTSKMKVTTFMWDEKTSIKHYEYAAYDAYLSLCTYLHIVHGFEIKNEVQYDNNYEMANDVFNFLMTKTAVFSTERPTTKTKIVNILSNSFKPWHRVYNIKQITRKVEEFLSRWSKEGLIKLENEDIYLLSKEIKTPSNNTNYEQLIIKGIRKIMPERGMKRESLVNWIRNSYYQQYTPNERMQMAADFMTKMIEEGIFYKIGIKYLLNEYT